MSRRKRVFIAVLSVLVVLTATYFVARRLIFSDPARSVWCRLTACPELDAYDGLCRVFARAELSGMSLSEIHTASTEESRQAATLLNTVLDRPAADRAAFVLESAQKAGAPGWGCPALERQIADL